MTPYWLLNMALVMAVLFMSPVLLASLLVLATGIVTALTDGRTRRREVRTLNDLLKEVEKSEQERQQRERNQGPRY